MDNFHEQGTVNHQNRRKKTCVTTGNTYDGSFVQHIWPCWVTETLKLTVESMEILQAQLN